MKTLYESILASTNSGKNAKITEKYILEKGFWKTHEGGAFEVRLPGPKYFYIYTWNNKFYVKIPKIDKGIIKDTKHFIETYEDFDLVMDYWESVSQKLPTEIIKQKKELVKNTLKRF